MKRQSKLPNIAGCCLMLLGFTAAVSAQTSQTGTSSSTSNRTPAAVSHTIRGKIFLPSGSLPEQRIRVVLEVTTGGVAQEVFSDAVGNFEFRGVSNNTYRITIPTDREFYDTAQEQLEVFGNFSRTFMVQIYLKEKTAEFGAKPKGKLVSAVDFSQEVPKAAKKSYEQSLKLSKEGKTAEAIALLQDAIKAFPTYLLALNRLGEQYMVSNKPDEAQPFFERALAVNPKYPLAHINLGVIFYEQKRFTEAIEHLEAANRVDESYPVAHLHLGRALMDKEPPDFDRAERALLRARELGGTGFAHVHLHLFNLHLRRQAYDKAAEQLEAYLKDAPNASNAASVRETLGKIKKQIVQKAEPVKKL